MELGPPGWLFTLAQKALATRPEARTPGVAGPPLHSRKRAASAYLRGISREGGPWLTPAARAGPAQGGESPDELPLAAFFRALAESALEIASLTGATGPLRPEHLLVLFAVHVGRLEEAKALDTALGQGGPVSGWTPLWTQAEVALAQRAVPLSPEWPQSRVLRRGALAIDARAFGREAIDYFSRGRLELAAACRRFRVAARQKAVLARVLTALSGQAGRPRLFARRALLRQIRALGLPAEIAGDLQAQVKAGFREPPSAPELVRGVRSAPLRRLLLQHALLASLVQGERAAREVAFIQELATALGFGPEELSRIEAEMAELYAHSGAGVDGLALSPGFEVLGEEWVKAIGQSVQKNFQRLMSEVRETGELSILLAKAARGHRLTRDERAKMRAQLIDVAKAIPALAIFAAPGGLLLLIALTKVLPFSLLPSAFQNSQKAGPPQPEERNRGARG